MTERPADAAPGPVASGRVDVPDADGTEATRERGSVRERQGAAQPRALRAVREILITFVLAALLYVVIQTFVAQTYRVEQQSMEPTLEPGQHVLIDKLTPRFDDYSRGDVVVFRPRGSRPGATPFIKRVIGVPGDHVEIRDGRVHVNGAVLEEPYLPGGEPTDTDGGSSSWVVEEATLFVLGDHRTASRDSRSDGIGLVSTSDVVGRAWLSFWPLDTLRILETPRYTGVPEAAP